MILSSRPPATGLAGADAGSEAGADAGWDAGWDAGAVVGAAVGAVVGDEPLEHAAAMTTTAPSMESRPRRDIRSSLCQAHGVTSPRAEPRDYGASGSSPASRRRKPASSSTGTPSSAAFWSLEPAPGPATT